MKKILTLFPLMLAISTGYFLKVADGAEHNLMPPGVQKYNQGEAIAKNGTGTHEDAKGSMTALDYIAIDTKDSVDKVARFYQNLLEVAPRKTSFGISFYLGQDVDDFGRYNVPVHLEVYESVKRERNEISEEKLFGGLKENLEKQQMLGSGRHDEDDFKQVKRKYAHLLKAWYPKYDVKEKIHECEHERQSNMEAVRESRSYSDEDEGRMTARMQQLIAQGRFDEAASIGRSMQNEGARVGMAEQNESMKDYWNNWISCYDEISKHAYPTRIMIWLVSNRFRPGGAEAESDENKDSDDSPGNELMDKGMDGLKGVLGL
ncbi:MAG: hypothetical protein ACE5IR_18535 [bacterium]